MKSVLWTALIVLAMSFGVAAQNDHTCQGNADCSTTNSTTNNPSASSGSGSNSGINYGTQNTGTQNTNSANAQGGTGVGGQGGQGGNAVSDNKNTNIAASSATGGQSTATGGRATANVDANAGVYRSGNSSSTGSTSNSGGNSTVVNAVQNVPHQAPAVSAPPAYPSAPCRVSGSAGASWLTGGVSFGGSKMDNECDKRETARSLKDLGLYVAACKVLMGTKAAKAAGLKEADYCIAAR